MIFAPKLISREWAGLAKKCLPNLTRTINKKSPKFLLFCRHPNKKYWVDLVGPQTGNNPFCEFYMVPLLSLFYIPNICPFQEFKGLSPGYPPPPSIYSA
jgi:hypothetical protein